MAFATGCAGAAAAVQECDLDGTHVNPNNGSTTAGKTGLMRCRDGPGGALLREQELKDGRFMGVFRRYENGALKQDYRVNERGNRDGVFREYEPAPRGGGAAPVLVIEETYRDGRSVGLARRWYPTGVLRRATFHGDDDREKASVEFTAEGDLAELSCTTRPVLAPAFDDARACGFGADSTVVLHAGKGRPKARVTWRRGESVRRETLWESGSVRDLRETNAGGGSAKSFAADGTLRRETQWLQTDGDKADGSDRRRVTTLEREFHESGKLIHEKRFRAEDRGGVLAGETRWYLNGQPRERTEYAAEAGGTRRSETRFHDNGKTAFEGAWLAAAGERRFGAERPLGSHRSYDETGRLRSESIYDARGRLSRERTFDERGTLVRDDEVFEDGSRK